MVQMKTIAVQILSRDSTYFVDTDLCSAWEKMHVEKCTRWKMVKIAA